MLSQSFDTYKQSPTLQFKNFEFDEVFCQDFKQQHDISNSPSFKKPFTKQILSYQNNNKNLNSKLEKHLEHLKVSFDTLSLKSEEIVNYQQCLTKKNHKINQLKQIKKQLQKKQTFIKQKQQQIKQSVLAKQEQILSENKFIFQEHQQIQRIIQKYGQLERQCNYTQQFRQTIQSKQIYKRKISNGNYQLFSRIDQISKELEVNQQRSCINSRQIQDFNDKLNKIIKIINSKTHKNHLLRQKLKQMTKQNKLFSQERVSQMKQQQKMQIKSLELDVGKLHQQLVFANQNFYELQESLIHKQNQIKNLKSKLLQLKNRSPIKIVIPQIKIIQRSQKMHTVQRSKQLNQTEQKNSKIQKQFEYQIIESDQQQDKQMLSKRRRVTGSITSARANKKFHALNNNFELNKLIDRYYSVIKNSKIGLNY